VKLVFSSFPHASFASLPLWLIFQCLFGYPVCVTYQEDILNYSENPHEELLNVKYASTHSTHKNFKWSTYLDHCNLLISLDPHLSQTVSLKVGAFMLGGMLHNLSS
jgi:hypothetical protein